MPIDTVPVDVTATDDGWRVCNHSPLLLSLPEPTPDPCFLNLFQTRPSYLSQYYSDLEFVIPPHKIYELLQKDCKIVHTTNGDAVPFKGYIGSVITKEDGTRLVSCYGQPAGRDPYHSEQKAVHSWQLFTSSPS